MHINPAMKTTQPRKKTPAENARALLRLRRQIENSMLEFDGHYAKGRFLRAMLDLLYRISVFDPEAEKIIHSVRTLTSDRRLQGAFLSSSRSEPSTDNWLDYAYPHLRRNN